MGLEKLISSRLRNGDSKDIKQRPPSPTPSTLTVATLPSYEASQASANKPNAAQAPPAYDEKDGPLTSDDIAKITAGFSNLRLASYKDKTGLVSRESCIAHLKLLECFYRLRKKIASTDGLFGIHNGEPHQWVTWPNEISEGPETVLGEKRWAVYLHRAVERFEKWRDIAAPSWGPLKRLAVMLTPYKIDTAEQEGNYAEDMKLPPIDVLMVWHAYSLNPRCYFEDCLREGRTRLWNTPFPWQGIADAIDDNTFEYCPPSSDMEHYSKAFRRHWLNEEDEIEKQITCIRCGNPNTVPWTSCTHSDTTSGHLDGYERLKRWSEQGKGFADQGFRHACVHCGTNIDREELVVQKFLHHTKELLQDDVPLPGTILGLTGNPAGMTYAQRTGLVRTHVEGKLLESAASSYRQNQDFPNRVMETLGPKLLDPNERLKIHSFESIRERIAQELVTEKAKSQIHYPDSGVTKLNSLFLRRTMSRYANNPSPFGLDLVGAVVRQGTFVTRMHDIDWLHSPALHYTLEKATTRYRRFLLLLGTDGDSQVVPTLDIDLLWHTHQLYPHFYFKASMDFTSRFIDHDDKITEVAISDSFASTTKRYQDAYNEPYSECVCWYCECIRQTQRSRNPLMRARHAAPESKLNELAKHPHANDPSRHNHISTHSLVKPTDSSAYNAEADSRAQALHQAYAKACERAQRSGRPAPSKSEFYYSDAYGRAVRIPAPTPFSPDAPADGRGRTGDFDPNMHATDPGCFAVGGERSAVKGAVCVAGTCAAHVAAGAGGDGSVVSVGLGTGSKLAARRAMYGGPAGFAGAGFAAASVPGAGVVGSCAGGGWGGCAGGGGGGCGGGGGGS